MINKSVFNPTAQKNRSILIIGLMANVIRTATASKYVELLLLSISLTCFAYLIYHFIYSGFKRFKQAKNH